jgi:hypothetical protein
LNLKVVIRGNFQATISRVPVIITAPLWIMRKFKHYPKRDNAQVYDSLLAHPVCGIIEK